MNPTWCVLPREREREREREEYHWSSAATVDSCPSAMNLPSPNSAYPAHRVPGLTRFGSAPSSLLASLIDSPAATEPVGGAAPPHFSVTPPEMGSFFSFDSTSNKRKFGLDLIRHRSSPPGFLSHLLLDNGFSSRESSFSQISELGLPETSSSIVFSGDGADEVNGDLITSLGSIDSNQFGLAKTPFEMENLFRMDQDSVPCKIRAKRGCATHPRSIAERERRTRISEKLKKLEDLVPNVDKQASTADMLDTAVDYIKTLQSQLEKLKKDEQNCKCHAKNAES